MVEMNMDCRSWEENIYWNHFQFIHFSQILHAGFDHQLAIPEKFAQKLRKKLPENVTLKGPSGVVWNVRLTTSDDTLMFKNGWETFVKDQSLKENDLLIFKYNGESHFDVLMLDGCSMCEKETSYFVRKCGNSEKVSNSPHTKRKMRECSVETLHTISVDDVECTPVTKVMNNGAGVAMGRRTSVRRLIKRIRGETVAKTATKCNINSKDCGGPDKGDEQHTPISRNIGNEAYYVSNRRPITEDEKIKALELADAASTDDSFIAIMRSSAVYKGFYLAISKVWMTKHLSPRNQDVILTFNSNQWHTRFNYVKESRSGRLSAGWKNFAVDNHLDTYDVCLFKPISKSNDSIVLNVNIFRVVPEVIPLPPVNSPSPLPSQCGQQESAEV